MKLKKYIVKDITEAMRMIKEDLGDDAVILSTRKIRKGGFLGIGSKTFFEVTAVVDEKEQPKKPKKIGREDIYKLQEILMKNRLERAKEIEPEAPSGISAEMEKIKEMISELKMMVLSGRKESVPPGIEKIMDALQYHDVDGEITIKISEFLRMAFGDVDPNSNDIQSKLVDYLRPFIKTEEVDLKGKVIFIGPTGVGKTTTLAKIAAKLKLEMKKRVAVLTLDTYRIAAAEQLKTYASIMDIPIRVAYTPQEARMELNAMIDYDVILMDTAGRSQKNELQMGELRAIVDSVSPDIIFLVISMTSRYLDTKDIIKKFKVASPTHIILTKMDETNALGHFVNIPYYSDIPIAFITNGQRVPEDIFEANSIELAKMLVKEVLSRARAS